MKRHAYPEETRELAIKMYYGGVGGCGVGKVCGMNKSNVMNWIKKRARMRGSQEAMDGIYILYHSKERGRSAISWSVGNMTKRKARAADGGTQ